MLKAERYAKLAYTPNHIYYFEISQYVSGRQMAVYEAPPPPPKNKHEFEHFTRP